MGLKLVILPQFLIYNILSKIKTIGFSLPALMFHNLWYYYNLKLLLNADANPN